MTNNRIYSFNKLMKLKDGQANLFFALLCIALFALLFSACTAATAEESSAPAESQAPDPTDMPAPTAAPVGPQIIYASQGTGNFEIFAMNVDGSDQRQLSDGNNMEWHGSGHEFEDDMSFDIQVRKPRWSPDNQQIAFEFTGNIYTMNADGSEYQKLTEEMGYNDYPVWSPDGRQIAFSSNQDSNRDIWVMNVDGTDLHQLTDNLVADEAPSWSPDGQTIAYYSGFPLVITLMNADGGDIRPLIEGKEGYGLDPVWSPDGQQIAFVSLRDGDDEIFVVNVNGSDLRQLTDNSDSDREPAWSSDGQQLAFMSDRDGDMEIFVMNADGSNVRQLTDNDFPDQSPSWSSMP